MEEKDSSESEKVCSGAKEDKNEKAEKEEIDGEGAKKSTDGNRDTEGKPDETMEVEAPAEVEKPEDEEMKEEIPVKEGSKSAATEEESKVAVATPEASPAKEDTPKEDKTTPNETKASVEKQQMSEQEELVVKLSQQNTSSLKALVSGFLTSKLPKLDRIDCYDELSEVFTLENKDSRICLEIYETFPLFLAHDGHFFVSVVFTNECWTKLRELVQREKLNLSDMIHYRLLISKFQFQLRKVRQQQQIFTSYATLEVRLIVHSSTVTLGSTHASLGIAPTARKKSLQKEMEAKTNRRTYARSLFKDDEVRTLLMAKFHANQVKYIEKSVVASR